MKSEIEDCYAIQEIDDLMKGGGSDFSTRMVMMIFELAFIAHQQSGKKIDYDPDKVLHEVSGKLRKHLVLYTQDYNIH
jgi:hypothetical protein